MHAVGVWDSEIICYLPCSFCYEQELGKRVFWALHIFRCWLCPWMGRRNDEVKVGILIIYELKNVIKNVRCVLTELPNMFQAKFGANFPPISKHFVSWSFASKPRIKLNTTWYHVPLSWASRTYRKNGMLQWYFSTGKLYIKTNYR